MDAAAGFDFRRRATSDRRRQSMLSRRRQTEQSSESDGEQRPSAETAKTTAEPPAISPPDTRTVPVASPAAASSFPQETHQQKKRFLPEMVDPAVSKARNLPPSILPSAAATAVPVQQVDGFSFTRGPKTMAGQPRHVAAAKATAAATATAAPDRLYELVANHPNPIYAIFEGAFDRAMDSATDDTDSLKLMLSCKPTFLQALQGILLSHSEEKRPSKKQKADSNAAAQEQEREVARLSQRAVELRAELRAWDEAEAFVQSTLTSADAVHAASPAQKHDDVPVSGAAQREAQEVVDLVSSAYKSLSGYVDELKEVAVLVDKCEKRMRDVSRRLAERAAREDEAVAGREADDAKQAIRLLADAE